MFYFAILANVEKSLRDTIGYEYGLSSSNVDGPRGALLFRTWKICLRAMVAPFLWTGFGKVSLIGPRLSWYKRKPTRVVLIKEKLKAAKDRQKSYADNRRKPLEFDVGDKVLLKVSPWKGVMRFGKKGKLAPRYVGPFEILIRIGPVAYRLRLPNELSEIMDREVKTLKRSKIPIVKVRWSSKRGPEFTWEREDHMKARYPQPFIANSSESSG
ncbi:hypothetical protein Tco_0438394 [Tanacetum coccineum]